jgi:hypothetical protein
MNDILNSKNKFLNLINLHLYDIYFSKPQHDHTQKKLKKKKNPNNTISIVIEFIANTNHEIQI